MTALQAWVSAHPIVAAALTWLLVTLLTWVFKARNPEEYDRMPPRVAAFLQLLGALFGDGRKIIEAASKVFSGKSREWQMLVESDNGRVQVSVPVLKSGLIRPRARGMATLPATMLVALVSAAVVVVVACVPHSQASTDAAARIAARNAAYDAEVMQCAREHAKRCADFNTCQRAIAAKYSLPLRGSCTEQTPAEARDAGLL